MSGNRYWGYVSGVVACTLRTIKGAMMCGAIAYIGGCLYCFRAIYINKCIRKHGIQIGM
jgi:hypothetical protein